MFVGPRELAVELFAALRESVDNFDIHLPLWQARHNKAISVGLFAAGVIFTLVTRWNSARAF